MQTNQPLPTIFIGHGGGPLPLLGHDGHADLLRTWAPGKALHAALHDPAVAAIVVVSAHYESRDGAVCIMNDPAPGLLFDYSGFPAESYAYTMPNPGDPTLAANIAALLTEAGIPANLQQGRGHDHGTFVPLMGLQVATQRPSLPVVSISLRGPASYDQGAAALTAQHWAMGQALAPLRQQGVLLLGSGNTYHGRASRQESIDFDSHLRGLATLPHSDAQDLRQWAAHPAAIRCHPRPEHLLPLLVCAGAAQAGGAATEPQVECLPHDFMGHAASHFVFA